LIHELQERRINGTKAHTAKQHITRRAIWGP